MSGLQVYIELWLSIENVYFIFLHPVEIRIRQLHVKVVQNPSQDQTHLSIGKTVLLAFEQTMAQGDMTYLRPMQFLGPSENGCKDSK